MQAHREGEWGEKLPRPNHENWKKAQPFEISLKKSLFALFDKYYKVTVSGPHFALGGPVTIWWQIAINLQSGSISCWMFSTWPESCRILTSASHFGSSNRLVPFRLTASRYHLNSDRPQRRDSAHFPDSAHRHDCPLSWLNMWDILLPCAVTSFYRFSIDYSRLNTETSLEHHPAINLNNLSK